MSYIGYCQECAGYKKLTGDLSCPEGHPRSQVRDVKDETTGNPYQARQNVGTTEVAQPIIPTKRCALCDFEYAEAYDGCPVCARSAQAVSALAVPATGSLLGALGAFLGYFFLVGLFSALSSNAVVGVGVALFVFSAIVTVDSFNLRKPSPERKVSGMAGSHPLVWGLATVMIAGIAIPLYFYQRPLIKAAYGT